MAETTAAEPVTGAGPTTGVASTRPGLAAPGERGRLRVADRAVERLAVAAARGVGGGVVVSAGLTGRSYPRAEVVVAGDRVRARIEVAGRWPTPADRLAADVRATVAGALSTLAGLRVDTVDVTVATFVRNDTPAGRRVQ